MRGYSQDLQSSQLQKRKVSNASKGSSKSRGESSGSRGAEPRPARRNEQPQQQRRRRVNYPDEPVLSVKQTPEYFDLPREDDELRRAKLLSMELEMEREAQRIVLEQQQAFKHQQHLLEHQAYVALEQQQMSAQVQMEHQVASAREEEATLARKLRDVEEAAIQTEREKKDCCSSEVSQLREYAQKLEKRQKPK